MSREEGEEVDELDSQPEWDVDICATIVSDRPPTLPLREEVNTLGFEVVLGASGTGVRASKYESKKAVAEFRKEIQIHDLKKRRLFPKSNSKILEKIEHRKQVEDEIALPHACSYETYETKLRRAIADAFESDSDSMSDWGRERRRRSKTESDRASSLFLAPDSSQPSSPSIDKQASAQGSGFSAFVFEATRIDEVPDVFGAFDNLSFDDIQQKDSGTTGVFDDILQALSGGEKSGKGNDSQSSVRTDQKQKTDISTTRSQKGPAINAADSDKTNPFSNVNVSSNPFDTVSVDEEKKDEEPSKTNVFTDNTENPNPSAACQGGIEPPLPSTKDIDSEKDTSMSAFDRATAQILKVAGIGTTSQPIVSHHANIQSIEKPRNPAAAWISSARNAFGNFSSEVFKVANCDKPREEKPSSLPLSEQDAVETIFSALQQPGVPLGEIKLLIVETPELPRLRQEKDGRLPLHALCAREMKDRSNLKKKKLTDQLLSDLSNYKQIIQLVVGSFPEACLVLDKKGDLPIHLIARGLMVWEATWYESVYKAAAKENDTTGGTTAKITKLYHGMSEVIEMLLEPITESKERDLFFSPGSMGTIYLLHIATIFTVSVRTLRLVLEAYPEAARTRCDLGILRTFVPDECIPLELHENLSTDYPKWENDKKAKQNDDDNEDTIRRSDLLFAYNPIEPHRFEKSRIHRLEMRIQFDAAIMVGKPTKQLEKANERVWTWFCTFSEAHSGRATYLNCVKRISNVLSLQAMQCLAGIRTKDGRSLVEAAHPDCSRAIKRRLKELGDPSHDSPSADLLGKQSHFISLVFRLVFNIPQTSVPTSFIILPFALQQDAEGRLQIESSDKKGVATEFAQCLVQFTEPQSIVDSIHAKILNHHGCSMFEDSSDEAQQEFSLSRLHDLEKSLLHLFKSGKGYLYLLDELTGLPRIESTVSDYPIVLNNPTSYVRKLLPLMMVGMIQMRGDKALSRLIAVLADKSISKVPPTWITARDLLLKRKKSKDLSDLFQGDTMEAMNQLERLGDNRPTLDNFTDTETSMWKSELSILGVLFKIHNSGHIDTQTSRTAETIASTENMEEEKKADDPSHGYLDSPPETYCDSLDFNLKEPDVIDLSQKMDELSYLQQRELNANGGRSDRSVSDDGSLDEEKFFIGSTFSVDENKYDEPTDSSQRKEMLSRYSLLFEDVTTEKPDIQDETRDEKESIVRIWNEAERIWEDVSEQLTSHPETFREDSQILKLKVDLAEQAKKLAELGKKVTCMREHGLNSEGRTARKIYDLTNVYENLNDSMPDTRELVFRLGDLEERLMCDEIQIQHLAMEVYSVEHEGDEMINVAARSIEKIPLARDISRISWGSNSQYRSFIEYERKASKPIRMVRFEDDSVNREQITFDQRPDSPVANRQGQKRMTVGLTTPLYAPQRVVHESSSDAEDTQSEDVIHIPYREPEPVQHRLDDSTEKEGTIEIETSCSSYGSSAANPPVVVRCEGEAKSAQKSFLLGPLPDLPSKPLWPLLGVDDAVTNDAVRSTGDSVLYEIQESEMEDEFELEAINVWKTPVVAKLASIKKDRSFTKPARIDSGSRFMPVYSDLPQDPSGIVASNMSSHSSKFVTSSGNPSKTSTTSKGKLSTEAVADSAKSSSDKPSTDAVAGDETQGRPLTEKVDALLNREIPAAIGRQTSSPSEIRFVQSDPLIEIQDSSSFATSSKVPHGSSSFDLQQANQQRQNLTRYQKLAAKKQRTRRFSASESDTSSSLMHPSVKAGSFDPSLNRLSASNKLYQPHQSKLFDTDSLSSGYSAVFRPVSVTVNRLEQREFSNLTSSHDSERQVSEIDEVIRKYTNEKLL